MPVGLIDSAPFKDMFGTAPMRGVFSDEGLLQRYLDIEVALARVQARQGMIPAAAAIEIERTAKLENLDMQELKIQTELVGRTILPWAKKVWACSWLGHGASDVGPLNGLLAVFINDLIVTKILHNGVELDVKPFLKHLECAVLGPIGRIGVPFPQFIFEDFAVDIFDNFPRVVVRRKVRD